MAKRAAAKKQSEASLLSVSVSLPDNKITNKLISEAIAACYEKAPELIEQEEVDTFISMVRALGPFDMNSMFLSVQVVVCNEMGYRIARNRSLGSRSQLMMFLRLGQTAAEQLDRYKEKMKGLVHEKNLRCES